MTFIFDLENEKQLPILYDITELAIDWVKKTEIIKRWRELPTLGSDATQEEKTEAVKSNVLALMKVICKEYPKETAQLCDKLWVVDTGERVPNVLMTIMKVIGDKEAVSFFQSVMSLM